MTAGERREVGVEIALELVHQRGELVLGDLIHPGKLDGVEQFRAEVAQPGQRRVEHRGRGPARGRAARPPHTQPRARQRTAVQESRVVAGPPGGTAGGRVGRVGACQYAEQSRSIRDGAGHRARSVLRGRDRHDP